MTIAHAEPNVGSASSSFVNAPAATAPGTRLVAGFFLVTALAGTGVNVPIHELNVATHSPSALSPTAADAVITATAAASTATLTDVEVVKWLKETSGLTWDQIGRVLGVSRRAVHLWVNGGRINSTNAEAVREFAALIELAKGKAGHETRATLLAISSDGMSPLDKFRQWQHGKSVDINGAPFSPSALLGAPQGDTQ